MLRHIHNWKKGNRISYEGELEECGIAVTEASVHSALQTVSVWVVPGEGVLLCAFQHPGVSCRRLCLTFNNENVNLVVEQETSRNLLTSEETPATIVHKKAVDEDLV